jgi:hypothetical protein
MFAIGALDAYFCDAYTDAVAAAIIAKSRQPSVELPDSFLNIKFPIRAILEVCVSSLRCRIVPWAVFTVGPRSPWH